MWVCHYCYTIKTMNFLLSLIEGGRVSVKCQCVCVCGRGHIKYGKWLIQLKYKCNCEDTASLNLFPNLNYFILNEFNLKNNLEKYTHQTIQTNLQLFPKQKKTSKIINTQKNERNIWIDYQEWSYSTKSQFYFFNGKRFRVV